MVVARNCHDACDIQQILEIIIPSIITDTGAQPEAGTTRARTLLLLIYSTTALISTQKLPLDVAVQWQWSHYHLAPVPSSK